MGQPNESYFGLEQNSFGWIHIESLEHWKKVFGNYLMI